MPRTNTSIYSKYARGITVIEMLVYTAILVLLLTVMIYTLMTMYNLYRSIESSAGIASTAHVTLERMTREIRGASSVNMAQSTLNASPGQLTLDTEDNGITTTVTFYMVGQTPYIKEGGVVVGPLAPKDARVTSLIFRRMATTTSEAVKIEMVVEGGTSTSYTSVPFYTTAVLRGSYPIQ